MLITKKLFYTVITVLLLSACSTGTHGSFVTNTYISGHKSSDHIKLGPVSGRSCQALILYFFPSGPAPSTFEAMKDAKGQYEDTKYLVDVSIDNDSEWFFGYSMECISVEAVAYK
jgi:hypothetical protein